MILLPRKTPARITTGVGLVAAAMVTLACPVGAQPDSGWIDLKGHGAKIKSLSFSPDSKRLATVDERGELRVWDIAAGTSRVLIKKWAHPVAAFLFDGKSVGAGETTQTPKGEYIYSVAVWNADTGAMGPTVFFESDLEAALAWIADWMKEKYGLHVELQTESDIRLEDQYLRLLLFDAVRELLLNVVKHAQTEAATVRAWKESRWLLLVVRDQGIGFHPGAIARQLVTTAGFGLANIQRSLQSVGGSFTIDSEKGHGTTLLIRVPFQK